jgi:hypothetical protein
VPLEINTWYDTGGRNAYIDRHRTQTLIPAAGVTHSKTSDSFDFPRSSFKTRSLGRPVLAHTRVYLPVSGNLLKTKAVFGV